jgi:threonine/homoserine/homoserine lactone efflux protein
VVPTVACADIAGNACYIPGHGGWVNLGNLWFIASFSFVVALSGALVPGPLLTYTIMKTLQVKHRGALVGALVILGHAILESVLVILLLAGFATLLKSDTAIKIIGTAGGAVLVYLGSRLVYDLIRGRVKDVFLNSETGDRALLATDSSRTGAKLPHPVLGGILVSMSNPYWWVWWASIGLAFMAQYKISFTNWPGLLAFFAGHEAGDLAVYWLVSFLVSLGKNRLKESSYRVILFACALIMISFGMYLGVKPYF